MEESTEESGLDRVQVDNEQLARSVKSIVRGIYHKETLRIKAPRILDNEYSFEFAEIDESLINGWIFPMLNIGATPHVLGNTEFEYQLKRFPQEPDTTLWTLCFFGALFYAGFTYPQQVISGWEHIRERFAELVGDASIDVDPYGAAKQEGV